jgi:hypothetical protein
MPSPVGEPIKALLKDAASKLTGAKRRAFVARTTIELFDGCARKAERWFGWNRQAITLGMHELRTGIECVGNYQASGRRKTEETMPELEGDIRSIADRESHADPRLKTTLAYTRLSASAVRAALIEQKGYSEDELPSVRTISTVLNRLGYRLRSVRKTVPPKKSQKLTRFSPTSPQ